MNWQRLISKLFASSFIVRGKVHPSFSQAGEDQVIRYLVNDCLQLEKPSYLDIGTHHPVFGNNTYYFYCRGSKGVCIEPDPRYAGLIRRYRKKDVFIEAGVGTGTNAKARFFVFPKGYGGWNTFSEEEAKMRKKETGIDFSEINEMPIVHINDVISRHFGQAPNIVSIDVEGLDLEIIRSLDMQRFAPDIICVESITFSNSNEQMKISEIPEYLESCGYFVFADTYVNTIFCKKEVFKKITR